MARTADSISRAAQATVDRIKATAKSRGMDPQKLIARYALERWLHRMTLTEGAGDFVLKGGMIMPLLGEDARPTQDIDTNLPKELPIRILVELVRRISCQEPSQEDGLTFDTAAIKAEVIREGILPGARLSFEGRLETRPRPTTVPVKLDVTYGDAINPDAVMATLPGAVKGVDPVRLAVYPWATVVAEKLHAVRRYGHQNTRLKDFYDLLVISRAVSLEGPELLNAVMKTFARWDTLPQAEPEGLSEVFTVIAADGWKRFLRNNVTLKLREPDFGAVVAEVRAFASPVLAAAAAGGDLDASWTPGSGWAPEMAAASGPVP